MRQIAQSLPPARQAPMEVALLPARPKLDFPTQVLFHSDAPIVPQKVDNWWLEPLRLTPYPLDPVGSTTETPPRAKQRLQQLLATGFVPKAVVVFHEIPGEQHRLSTIERAAV